MATLSERVATLRHLGYQGPEIAAILNASPADVADRDINPALADPVGSGSGAVEAVYYPAGPDDTDGKLPWWDEDAIAGTYCGVVVAGRVACLVGQITIVADSVFSLDIELPAWMQPALVNTNFPVTWRDQSAALYRVIQAYVGNAVSLSSLPALDTGDNIDLGGCWITSDVAP